MLCIVICCVGLDGLLDAATGQWITRETIAQFTGYGAHMDTIWDDAFRFGLRRATGPLEHPILFGFVSAIGFLFALSIKVRWRSLCIFGCIVGVIVCGSTAAWQVAILGSALLIYSRMFRKLKNKWVLLWTFIFVAIAVIFASSSRPFGQLIELFTIDPSTAYYRLYIWNSVGPAILQNPYFTVLEGDYDYRGSVNSVWLVLSLQYGMVCAIFTALSMLGSCSIPTRNYNTDLSLVEQSVAETTTILILLSVFMGLTVHLWGSSWILLGLLVGLRAHLGEAGRTTARTEKG